MKVKTLRADGDALKGLSPALSRLFIFTALTPLFLREAKIDSEQMPHF